jgi:hypothetical protein
MLFHNGAHSLAWRPASKGNSSGGIPTARRAILPRRLTVLRQIGGALVEVVLQFDERDTFFQILQLGLPSGMMGVQRQDQSI